MLAGRSLDAPLLDVMSSPVVSLQASATAYEAMHVMAERGVRQVVVVENGLLVGVVNERDLFSLQRVSMRQVNEGLHAADSVDKLKRAAEDIRLLDAEPARAGRGCRAADAHDRRAQRRALAPRDRARPRATRARRISSWCWLALGSEGRGEQTFATDQDNALLFVADDAAQAAIAARAARSAFAREVNECLDRLGFPLCPAT